MQITKVSEALRHGLIAWRRQQTIDNERVSMRAYAEFLGVTHPTLKTWLSGDHMPTVETMQHLAYKLQTLIGDHAFDLLGLDRPDQMLHELRAKYDATPEDRRREMLDLYENWLQENNFWRQK